MPARFTVRVTHPLPFISAVLRALKGPASLSLEGDLSQADFQGITYDWDHPTSILSRNTIWPVQDFVIVPLTNESVELLITRVLPHVGLRTRVLHLLIERNAQLFFAAYDQFAPDSVWIDAAIGEALLNEQLAEGTINTYKFLTTG